MSALNKPSRNILLSLILGALVGTFLPTVSSYVSFLGLAFKLSLQMLVMPIVLTSILCGLESIGDISRLKALGKRAMIYYFLTTVVAIMVGMFLVTAVKPGVRPPSAEKVHIIDNAPGNSKAEVGTALKMALGGVAPLKEDEKLKESLFGDIDRLIISAGSIGDLRDRAKSLLGSIELRSRLSAKSSAEPLEPPSFQRFFEDQLKNALINPFEALAKQQVLAVIVFTLLLGAAMTTIGPMGAKFFEMNRAVNMALIKLIGLIMRFAPLGVFGLLASVVSTTGPEVFRELSLYALCVVVGLMFHLLIFLPLLNYLFTRQSPKEFLLKLRPALMVAFSTSSSNATLPVTMKVMEEDFLVDKRISRFVLPLGATVNMDGTALYEAVAAIFIAQLYGVTLDLSSQLVIAMTAAFASVGTAGIPAAGTVTMAMILSAVGLPMEGVGLLLALDRPLDMCRTVVNIAGDATGCHILHRLQYAKNKDSAPISLADNAL